MFAGTFFKKIPVGQHNIIVENVKHKLYSDLFRDGRWFADYKRIRVMGVKEV